MMALQKQRGGKKKNYLIRSYQVIPNEAAQVLITAIGDR